MDLKSSEGSRPDIKENLLVRLLERPTPLLALCAPGTALVTIHTTGSLYMLMHWNGRVWQRAVHEVQEGAISALFMDFFHGRGDWRQGLIWEPIAPPAAPSFPPPLPTGVHVLLTFLLTFGGFTLGAILGIAAGRQLPPYDAILVYVFAILLAPPLAITGQYAARQIPSACEHCGEIAIALQAGRFAYLCPDCGHLNITSWGINRGPMAP